MTPLFNVYRDRNRNQIIDFPAYLPDVWVGDVDINTASTDTGSITVPYLGPYVIHEELSAGSAYQQPTDKAVNVTACGAVEVTFTNELEVIEPGTLLDIQASPTMVYPGDPVVLTITEENTGDVDITNPHVVLTPPGVTLDELSTEFVGGDTDGDGELDVDETWEWQVTVNPTTATTFTAVGHGTDPQGNDITNPPYEEEEDSVEVEVSEPGTLVDIQASPTTVSPGDPVVLTITEENTGDVDITNPHVVLTPPGVTLDELSTEFVGGDTDGDGELDVGEIWEWQVTVNPTTTTTYTAVGHGLDPLGNDITYPDYPTEQAEVTVEVTGDATRTPGFWQTHYDYTKHVFNEHLGGTINLGWKTLDSEGDVFGMLWANNARESDDSRRDKLCQARVTVSFQAVAAILNSGLGNGAPLPVSLADIAAILGGTDIKAIRALGEILDAYNNSGVDVDIVDDCPYPVLPADPNAAKEAADITIADC